MVLMAGIVIGVVCAVGYVDKRPFHMVSSKWNPLGSTEVRRWNHKTHFQDKPHQQPNIVYWYNQFMSGVDLADQYMVACNSTRRTQLHWYHKLFYFALNAAVNNTRIIYHYYHPNRKLTMEEFRLEIIMGLLDLEKVDEGMVKTTSVDTKNDQPMPGRHVTYPYLGKQFIPFTNTPAPENAKRIQLRCKYCPKIKVTLVCKQCGEGFCVGECFERHCLSDVSMSSEVSDKWKGKERAGSKRKR